MKLNPHYSTLEQLPLIREKRVREDRILYGHGKASGRVATPVTEKPQRQKPSNGISDGISHTSKL